MSKFKNQVWSYTKMRELIVEMRKQGFGWYSIHREFQDKHIISARTKRSYSISGVKAIYHTYNRKKRKQKGDEQLIKAADKILEGLEHTGAKAKKDIFDDTSKCNSIDAASLMPPMVFEWSRVNKPRDVVLETISELVNDKDVDDYEEIVAGVKAIIKLWKKTQEKK